MFKASFLNSRAVQAVLRTGGSAEIPIFIDLLGTRFGVERIQDLNPFTSIVDGLALKDNELSRLASSKGKKNS